MFRALMFRALMFLASVTGVPLATAPLLAATTIQQDFDAAEALLDAGKVADARNAFTALLARFSPTSQGKAVSLVRARLGSALIATGEADQAEPILVAAVSGLKGTSQPDIEERGVALYDLGRARESIGSLDAAAESYRAAVASGAFPAGGASDIGARAALARSVIWSNPAQARQLLDGLLALPPETFGKSQDQRALLQTLRGRVELNANNPTEAKRWFAMAARTAGGATTTSVSLADVRIRGDLALANFKLGNMAEVQRFAALSGAGQLINEGLALASQTPLPACAPLTGLATDAVAVIEFGIAENGRTVGVTPIFADGGADGGTTNGDRPEILFVQAVRDWFWAPDKLAKLDPFWRQAVRVELRCFTNRPDSDPVLRSFQAEGAAWYDRLGVRDLPGLPDNDASALSLLRAELSRRETADRDQPQQLLPALVALASNAAAPVAERRAAIVRWTALTRQFDPPFDVRTDFRLTEINWLSDPIPSLVEILRFKRKQQTALLNEIEASGQGESRPAMLVRLRLGETLAEMKNRTDAKELFAHIVASPEAIVPAGDAIRISALLRISNMAAAASDMATAADALAATGLTPEQCSLVDIRPEGINNKISSSAISTEARRWGNGGFVKAGFDITADGHTTNIRTIVAAPPFIFSAATEKAISQHRYRPVFRPGNTLGCTGTVVPVRFLVL